MGSDDFDQWLLSAQTSINNKQDQKENEKMWLNNKNAVFEEFVGEFCETVNGENVLSWEKIKTSQYSTFCDFSNFYDFTGRYAIKK
jgi:hypothetical protein